MTDVLGPDMVGDWDVLGPSTALRIWEDDEDNGLMLVLGPSPHQRQIAIGKRRKKPKVRYVYAELIGKVKASISVESKLVASLEAKLGVPVDVNSIVVGKICRKPIMDMIARALKLKKTLSNEEYIKLLKELLENRKNAS